MSSWAHDFEVDGIYYDVLSEGTSTGVVGVTHKTSTVNDSNSYSGELVIPDNVSYNGKTYSVTQILERAFQGSTDLTKVTLGKNIVKIYQYAFLHTWALNSVAVGSNTNFTNLNGVLYTADKKALLFCPRNATSLTIAPETEVIDDFSLEQCTRLSSVVMNGKVTRIGVSAFYGCTSLLSLDLKNSVVEVDRAAFKNSLHLATVTGTGNIKTVGISAFEDSGLGGELDLHSVTDIGEYAFQKCGITKLTLGPVTYMGNATFMSNRKLTELIIKSGAKTLGAQAFADCTSLATITSECTEPPYIYSSSFSSISASVTLNVPQGCSAAYQSSWVNSFSSSVTVSASGDDSASDTPSADLTYSIISATDKTAGVAPGTTKYSGAYQIADEVVIDGVTYTVTEVLDNAFYGCSGVTKVVLGKNVVKIGKSAFESSGITEMDFNDKVTRIEQFAFSFCKSLKKITGLNALEIIANQAFYTDPIEGELVLPNIQRLVSSPFQKINITKITLGENLVTGSGVSECKFLKEIVFLGNKFDEVYSLNDNTALESISVPSSVTSIGSWAFRGCTSLKSVTGSVPTEVNYDAFKNTALESFDLTKVVNIGHNAFENTKLTEIIFSDKISTIDAEAFKGCKYVKSIKCLNLAVPTTGEGAFNLFGTGGGEVVVTVPAYSLEAYKAAWKDQLENGVAKVTFVGDETIKAEIGVDDNGEVAINGLNFPTGELLQIATNSDTDGNGKLSKAERDAVTAIELSSSMTRSLKGLEYFEKLSRLTIRYCELTELDLSLYKDLTYLYLYWTNVEELDLTNNTKLTSVTFSEDRKLQVVRFNKETSKNIGIGIGRNSLTGVGFEDFYGSLKSVSNGGIQSYEAGLLTERTFTIDGLDMSLVSIPAGYEDKCQIVDGKFVPKFSVNKTSFRYLYKFKNYGSLTVDVAYQYDSNVPLTFFEDANFRNCIKAFDTDDDGYLSSAEITAVTSINVASKNIQSLAGIEIFTNLESLNCSKNNLVNLDLRAFSSLSVLNHSGNTRNIGNVYMKNGFSVPGLDMSRVKLDDLYGATVKDGKFIPNAQADNMVYYGYATNSPNENFPYFYVTLSYTPLYVVTFVNYDGSLIDTQDVIGGSSAEAPVAPTRNNYTFVGWDTAFDNIQDDVTITALYKRDLAEGEIEISRSVFRDERIYNVAVAGDIDKSGTLTVDEIANITVASLVNDGPISAVPEVSVEHPEDLNYFSNIESLTIKSLKVEDIDFSKMPKLHKLTIENSLFDNKVDFSTVPQLDSLRLVNSTFGDVLDVTGNEKLVYLYLSDYVSQLKDIKIGDASALQRVSLAYCNIPTVDFSKAVNLESLSVTSSKLIYLDLANNTKLASDLSVLRSNGVIELGSVDASGFDIDGLDMSKVTVVSPADKVKVVDGKFVSSLDCTEFTYGYATGNEALPTYSVKVSMVGVLDITESSFPDANFRRYVENNVDANGDKKLSIDEVAAVESVNLYWKFVSNLKGLEFFTNLKTLNVEKDSLVALDLAPFTKLASLRTDGNARDIKGYVSSIDGFAVQGLDMDRVDATSVKDASVRNGKFYPAANSSSLSYEYLTNSPVQQFAKVRFNLKYNRLIVVNFIDHDGSYFDRKEVVKGNSVELPADEPFRPGYTFMGWDIDNADAVYYDTDVKAKYELIEGGVADTIKIAIDEVNFPDREFRNSIKEDFDRNKDGFLTTSEVNAITDISYTVWGISDLKGVEFFTELRSLAVNSNRLTSLDLSKNTKLETLQCYSNKITELDLSNNKALRLLLCRKNGMEKLILPESDVLYDVECQDNALTELDFSKCPNVSVVDCSGNNLTTVNVNGLNISSFDGSNNKRDIGEVGMVVSIPGLDMSRVRNVEGATVVGNSFMLSSTGSMSYEYYVATYKEYGMEVDASLKVTLTFTSNVVAELEINETNFPDAQFRSFVSTNFDTNANGTLSVEERMNVTSIVIGSGSQMSISSVKGIEHFPMLEKFEFVYHFVSEYDFSQNVSLKSISIVNSMEVKKLDISNCVSLQSLKIDNYRGEGIDLSNNKELTNLDLRFYSAEKIYGLTELSMLTKFRSEYCDIKQLDLSNNTGLTSVYLSNNASLTELNLSMLENLSDVTVHHVGLSSLDLSANTSLTSINVSDNSSLESVVWPQISDHSVDMYFAYNSSITDVDFGNIKSFTRLEIRDVPITSLDISDNEHIDLLYLTNTNAPYVKTGNAVISRVVSSGNAYDMGVVNPDGFSVEGMDMSKVTIKSGATIADGKFVLVPGSEIITYTYTIGKVNADFSIIAFVKGNGLAVDETNFPDEVFRRYVSENFDTDNDGELRYSERHAVKNINISYLDIYDLTGIEHFESLEYIKTDMVPLRKVDFSNNKNLVEISLVRTELLGIDLSYLGYSTRTALSSAFSIPAEGISIEGLDENNITDLVGGKIVDGMIVPESDDVSAITYSYNVRNPYGSTKYLNVKLFVEREGFKLVAINEVNFPDETFRSIVSYRSIDLDGDGYLTSSELENATRFNLQGYQFSSLKGLEFFTELQELYYYGCSGLDVIDLSKNTKLTSVSIQDSGISEIIFPEENEITYLNCAGNKLTSLDVSSLSKLKQLICSDNELTSLDLTKNLELTSVQCTDNMITSLDLSQNTEVTRLLCNRNKLTELIVKGTAINYLDCSDNCLFTLDLKDTRLTTARLGNQHYDAGMVDARGFVLDGLDMDMVIMDMGATIVDGKFVPATADATSLRYFISYYSANGYNIVGQLIVTVNFTIDPTTPVDAITVDGAPAEYYNLYGHKINAPTKGVVIKKQNGKTQKILVK